MVLNNLQCTDIIRKLSKHKFDSYKYVPICITNIQQKLNLLHGNQEYMNACNIMYFHVKAINQAVINIPDVRCRKYILKHDSINIPNFAL